METIKIDRLDNAHGNATPRFIKFRALTPMHVGKRVCVSDGQIEVVGKITSCDWQGNAVLDTKE